MPSSEREEPKFHLPQLMLLITVIAGGAWFYEGPLKSSRPVQREESRRSAPVVDNRVEARLWQDPFEAVDTHIQLEKSAKRERLEQGPGSHSHQLTQLTAELADSYPLPRHVEVLAVLADGSPYAESRETRLRQRFAVLSGLGRAGYDSVDSEHIRFFSWQDEEVCQGTSSDQQSKTSLQVSWSSSTEAVKTSVSDSPKNPCSSVHGQAGKYEYWRHTPVPVEWYRSQKTAFDGDVLVFWIKDQDLGNRPTESLRAIQRTVMNAFPPFRPTVSFKVIGPRFSGTLQAMIDEIGMPEKAESQDALLIYSPWSTAPEHFLTGDDKSVANRLEKVNATFIRTIPTDAQLIDALFGELERRGVALECESAETCNHIAVISEWDTLYGRTLPKLVKNRLSNGNNGKSIGFHQYSYLRGLDGELPQTKSKNNSEPSSVETTPSILSPKDRRQDVERMERPEGRSQLDYVRQLTELIREKEWHIRAECGLWKKHCPGFRAIGVLGSDVYDKLLILQALKKIFPHVIFFTTDLDARLFHPSELPWTRNLVVASHFDLRLNEQLQGSIPPFRDTYQTATFFTILRAVDFLQKDQVSPKKLCIRAAKPNERQASIQNNPECFTSSPQTKLHEIGRNGPVDISISAYTYERDLSPFLESISTMRAAPANPDSILKSCAYVVIFLLMIWLLLIPSSLTISKLAVELLDAAPPKQIVTLFIGFACAIGLFATVILLHLSLTSDSYKGEPLSFFDGVSIWPSQILRATVITLALLFLWQLLARHRQACRDVEKQFSEHLPEQKLANPPSLLTALFYERRQMSIGRWTLETTATSPDTLWKEYCERQHLSRIIARVAPWTLMVWAIGFIVLGITGEPFTPFRGTVSKVVNLALLIPAVPLMIGVIFLVLDITRLTSVFVAKLIPKDPRDLEQLAIGALRTRLRIIARLTSRIDTFIYYPAGLLILMLSARSDYIDNWDFPLGLMIVIGLSAFYVIVSAFQLRWASERARRRVLDELSRPKWIDPTSNSGVEKEIQQVIDEVKGLNEGAFMPITHLPVFRAVTLPTGAVALLALIEALINN